MLNSPLYGRVFLAVSLVSTGIGVTGCATDQQNSQGPAGAHQVKTASIKKQATIAKTAKAKAATPVPRLAQANDPLITASLAAHAPMIGRTWNYEYRGSRGTITYHADGTATYNEPGLRQGSGKWQMRGKEFCQSFSGIKEPCVRLRQSGKAIYVGDIKLTQAE